MSLELTTISPLTSYIDWGDRGQVMHQVAT